MATVLVHGSTLLTLTVPRTSRYIATPAYDLIFFILSPFVSIGLGYSLFSNPRFWTHAQHAQGMILGFLAALTQAHLFAVIFRSHANQSIFRQFPMRFTVVPIVLFIGFVSSLWLLVAGIVLSVWWDVYHSSLQTFGLGRIYDAKNGSDPNAGRMLDIWMNHVLYIGPILGGAALIDHLQMTAPVTQ